MLVSSPSLQYEVSIKNFKKGQMISEGEFGIVYGAEDRNTGKLYAAKVINCSNDEEQCTKIINHEIKNLMSAHHHTIIQYFGYSKIDFEEKHNVTLIMELSKNGSLKHLITSIMQNNKPKNYTNTSKQIIIAGVACAMKYLHDHGIIHKNLNAGSVLLGKDFHPKIIDFGFSQDDLSKSENQSFEKIRYKAPELLRYIPFDSKIDIYAFGILMFEIINDSFAFPELEKNSEISEFDFRMKILSDKYRPKFEKPIKQSLRSLIEECWSDDPKDRPQFDEVFKKLTTKSDYLLDDVDQNEFKNYIDEINDQNDFVLKCDNEILRLKNIINELTIQNEKILNENRDLKEKNNVLEIDKKQQQRKIAVMENEIEQLKNENMILKINNDKYLKQISNNESQINAFNQEPNKRFIRMSSSEAFLHEQNKATATAAPPSSLVGMSSGDSFNQDQNRPNKRFIRMSSSEANIQEQNREEAAVQPSLLGMSSGDSFNQEQNRPNKRFIRMSSSEAIIQGKINASASLTRMPSNDSINQEQNKTATPSFNMPSNDSINQGNNKSTAASKINFNNDSIGQINNNKVEITSRKSFNDSLNKSNNNTTTKTTQRLSFNESLNQSNKMATSIPNDNNKSAPKFPSIDFQINFTKPNMYDNSKTNSQKQIVSVPKFTADPTPNAKGTVGATNVNNQTADKMQAFPSFNSVSTPSNTIIQNNTDIPKFQPITTTTTTTTNSTGDTMNTKELPKSSFAFQDLPNFGRPQKPGTRRRSSFKIENPNKNLQSSNGAADSQSKNDQNIEPEYEYTYDYEEDEVTELQFQEEERKNAELIEKQMEGNILYSLHVVILQQWRSMLKPPKFAPDKVFPCQVFPIFATILHTKILTNENQPMLFSSCLQIFATEMKKMPATRDDLFLTILLLILLIRTQAQKYKLDQKRCESLLKIFSHEFETNLHLLLETSLDKAAFYVELFSEANFNQQRLLDGFTEIFKSNKNSFTFGSYINNFLIKRFTELLEEKMLNRIIAKTDKFTFSNAIKWNNFLISLEKDNDVHMKVLHQAINSFIMVESITKTPSLVSNVCPDISPALVSFFISHLKSDENMQNLPKPAKFNKEFKLNKAPKTFDNVIIKKNSFNITTVLQQFTLDNWNNIGPDEPNVKYFSFFVKYIKENE